MPLSGKVLEDSIRLSKIRRIKRLLYVVQTVFLVSLAFVVVFLTGSAVITPSLHLPIASFVAVIVLLLLLVCVESFFFRMLEIKFARSSSARHLMAKNSMKRSLLFAVLSAVFVVVLTVPSILGAVEKASNQSEIVGGGSAVSFYSSDHLDLMNVESVKVSTTAQVQVYLVTAKNFDDYSPSMAELFNVRLNRPVPEYVVNDSITIGIPQGQYIQYYLIVNDIDQSGASVTISVMKTVSKTFTSVVSLFLIAFVVANLAWIAYLVPVERKYSAGSIYK